MVARRAQQGEKEGTMPQKSHSPCLAEFAVGQGLAWSFSPELPQRSVTAGFRFVEAAKLL